MEHPAVAVPCESLEREGFEVIRVGPDDRDADSIIGQLGPSDMLAVQWVNHEVGTVLPVPRWAELAHGRGARVFVDATQALGKIPIALSALPVDALALSAHKVGGPAGAGALWVRRTVDLPPMLVGGGQERGRRAGSPDVIACVGFGAACEVLQDRLTHMLRVTELRDRLERGLQDLGGIPNRSQGARVATVANVSFRGRSGPALVAALDLEGLCVSHGAACSSGKQEPSTVVMSLHPQERWRAESALRFSLGPETTEQDVALGLGLVKKVLGR
jgi:cysteine desulfurase